MRWLDPDWRAEAEGWIRDRVEPTGELDQFHVYPWSTVIRVPTAQGDVWFKAVAEIHAFEPPLAQLLWREFPDLVTEVIESDADRGFILMRDAGLRLRELEPAERLRRWEALLPRYAEIQIALAPRAGELRDVGVPDFALAAIPARVEAVLDDERSILLDEPEGLTSAQRDELRRRLPEVRTLVEEIAAAGVPETIQHDDLHDGQVFVRDGREILSDWGDSCVSHPFHTLTVTLRALAWRHDLPPGAPELLRLRDAYLEPFRVDASVADAAYRTGTLGRALAWHRYLRARETMSRDDAESVAYGLRLYLEGGPIGTWD
jgi:Phosphotransferase enzyme family